MSRTEKWQDAIQQRQVAKAKDFDDYTNSETAKIRAFEIWYLCFYPLPDNPWKRDVNGRYVHDDVRRGFRAFSAGFGIAASGELEESERKVKFEKWHSALMPSRYEYRHAQKINGDYFYANTARSYDGFAHDYEAGVKFYKQNNR